MYLVIVFSLVHIKYIFVSSLYSDYIIDYIVLFSNMLVQFYHILHAQYLSYSQILCVLSFCEVGSVHQHPDP